MIFLEAKKDRSTPLLKTLGGLPTPLRIIVEVPTVTPLPYILQVSSNGPYSDIATLTSLLFSKSCPGVFALSIPLSEKLLFQVFAWLIFPFSSSLCSDLTFTIRSH